MGTFNFNNQEKEFILLAISKRRAAWQDEFYKNALVELDIIESELKMNQSHLKPKHKSIIIGCLLETFNNPNKNLLQLNDFQIIFETEEVKSKMESLDVVLNLQNKLLKKSEKKHRLFAASLNKVNGILNSERVLYSTTPERKIYKAGIIINEDNGIAFELDGWSEPANLEVGKLYAQYYLETATPVVVKNLIDEYSLQNELTEMQNSFKKIVNRICEHQQV